MADHVDAEKDLAAEEEDHQLEEAQADPVEELAPEDIGAGHRRRQHAVTRRAGLTDLCVAQLRLRSKVI